MRHRKAHRKLGRVSEHRTALLRNQADGAADARTHRDDGTQGQGTAAVRREDHHHRQARGEGGRPEGQDPGGASGRWPRTCTTPRWWPSCSTAWRPASRTGPAATPASSSWAPAGATRAEVALIELVGSEFDPKKAEAERKAAEEAAQGGGEGAEDAEERRRAPARGGLAAARHQEGEGRRRLQAQGEPSCPWRGQEGHHPAQGRRLLTSLALAGTGPNRTGAAFAPHLSSTVPTNRQAPVAGEAY